MKINEIKKLLYKQKPKASFQMIRMGNAYYKAYITVDDNVDFPTVEVIIFEIPVDDMGNADFHPEMEAHLLNRWIVENEVV